MDPAYVGIEMGIEWSLSLPGRLKQKGLHSGGVKQ